VEKHDKEVEKAKLKLRLLEPITKGDLDEIDITIDKADTP
jgi:hypothetical protein